MAEFHYKARDSRGKLKTGKVTANSKGAVRGQLLKMRLRPITIKATKLDKATGSGDGQSYLGGILFKDKDGNYNLQLGEAKATDKDLIIFSKQFATMIASGVPLIQTLGILASQQRVRGFGRMLDQVRGAVENGATLSDALEAFPNQFDSLYVSMVRAGEASGNLDTIMMKLVTYIEKAAKIKSQVKGAMMYPMIVVFVAIVVITGLLVFVVPMFAKQYEGSGKELPGLTQVVIDISNMLVDSWYVPLGIMVAIGGMFSQWVKTDAGRAKFDAFMLKVPVFGQLMRKISVGRFCSTMATMLTSGVPLLEALSICAASSGNKTIEKFVINVRSRIEQGSKFSEPLGEGGLFPPMVVSMVAVGETTGALDDMLVKVSEFYEDEVDLAVKTMLSMIEPIMIVGIGGIVGFVVMAMYLPVFDLGNVVGG